MDHIFKLLEKLLEKHVLPGDGEICFSAEDLRRMPEGFEEKIKPHRRGKRRQSEGV